ncbi:MAG TPA: MarR family transcriptional regulator [Nocardioidaceae bacterium]|nr:MarR family transcriptional regulator [Nocardioidaceae bacterium]
MASTIEQMVRTDTGLAAGLRIAVARLTRRIRSERDPDNELSLGQLSVLGSLYRGGACSIGELAAVERVQPPSMTRTVNCLEEDGYVVRKPHATDGRQVVIELADKGRSTLEADRRRRDAWLAQRLRELTPEERSVLRRAAPILERLASV